ncbi:hypothetical protein [Enterococcus mundtii]|uniref:Uncharacterized protein n=1 Tax=Enterococcus mundtii TaxID=53346 RepID=A0A1I4MVY2_ENTMU|nr:hypothetical protein [Enterococcus mundtii]OTP26612.1 hypothetical protein A5802_000327 [Enterococcus mundtii]SFM07449.1 hypothetical protein SAMN04487758_10974 [Enterococcus mundtii]
MVLFNNGRNKIIPFYTKIKWSILIIFASLFIISIAYFFHYLFTPIDNKQMSQIDDSWVYYSEHDPYFQFDSNHIDYMPSIDKNEPFIMETTLHKELADANLLIKGNHQWLSVSLDDTLLYSRSKESARNNPGLSLSIIDLPESYVGKTLKIVVSSPYQNYAGLTPKVYLGTTSPMISFIFSQSIPQVIAMILAFVIAIGLLIWTSYILYRHNRLDRSLLILSLFSFVLGFESISEDILSGVLFEPIVHSIFSHLFAILTSILIIFYYQSKMTNYQKWYGYFCYFQTFVFANILIYALFSDFELPELMPFASVVSVVSTLVTSIASIGEAYKQNRFFTVCSPWIVLIAIFHCMFYIQTALGIGHSIINWSTLLFAILLIVIVGYNIMENIMKIDSYHKERLFLQTKTDLIETHYTKIQAQIQQIDQAKNDFVVQMEELSQLIDKNEQAEAKTYLERIVDETRRLDLSLFPTGHQLTNLILARYQEVAAKKNIKVDFHTHIPASLPIHDEDFTQLLIHILEHSFRETQAIENPLHREIYLSIQEINSHIQIHCEHSTHYEKNIFSKDVTEELIRQEQYDLMMIQNTLEKYSSTLIQEKDKWVDRLKINISPG